MKAAGDYTAPLPYLRTAHAALPPESQLTERQASTAACHRMLTRPKLHRPRPTQPRHPFCQLQSTRVRPLPPSVYALRTASGWLVLTAVTTQDDRSAASLKSSEGAPAMSTK
jgi:hypothetical protein